MQKRGRWLRGFVDSGRRMGLVLFIAAFGVVGTMLLLRSFAATNSTAFEPETGVASSKVITVDDQLASKGRYVRFSAASGTRYEAEAAQTNAAKIYTGKEFASERAVVGVFGESGKYVTFTVAAPMDGNYPASLRYAAADSNGAAGLNPLPRTMAVNTTSSIVSFPRTSSVADSWSSQATFALGSLPLKAGDNTITFRIDISGMHFWDVDYLEIVGTTKPVTPTPPPTNGTKCVIDLHGRGGAGWPFDAATSNFTVKAPNGNGGGGGSYYWIYDPGYDDTAGRGYFAARDIIQAQAVGCDRIILHGFSNGGGMTAAFYCKGETFGGKIVGYIIDDPELNAMTDNCARPAGIRVVAYWTGGLNNFGNLGWSAQMLSDDLGIPVTQSIHGGHSPWENPPVLSQWW